jgi:hypothetical protein
VKKNQWSTPAGIDHDYNYLRTVESSIDGADRDGKSRGIGVVAPSLKGAARAWQPGSRLQQYLAKNEINVERAPVGMSRSKSNQTRISKSGNVNWTVEWVDVDGVRQLHNEGVGSVSLEDLYTTLQAETRNSRRRGAGPDESQTESPAKRRRMDECQIQANEAPGVAADSDDLSKEPIPPAQSDGEADTDIAPSSMDEVDGGKEAMDSQQYFYLLRPATASASRVLIPCDANTTLTDALQSRTIQEYPTIYVLRQPSSALPTGFMSEKEYLNSLSTAKERTRLKTEYSEATSHDQTDPSKRGGNGRLDANAILDMLRRDVTV